MNSITIRQKSWTRKDGIQVMNYQLDYRDHNGKRCRPQIDAKPIHVDDREARLHLKAEAMRQAQIIQRALQQAQATGNTQPAQAISKSVLQMFDEYLAGDRERTRKGHYMRQRLAKFKGCNKPLASWTRQDSKDLLLSMAREYSQQTLVGYWRAFKRAMQYACDSGQLASNPASGIDARGGLKTTPQENTLRPDELEQLLATPFREDMRGIAEWTLRGGFYYSDFQKLYRSNLQLQEDGNYVLSWGRKKTIGRSKCIVKPAMLQHATGSGDQLFPRMKYSQVTINKHLAKWAAAAGLMREGEPLRLSHVWLRRTYGDLVRRQNPDPYVLRDALAHTSLKAQQHYVNPDASELIATSKQLGQYLDKHFT